MEDSNDHVHKHEEMVGIRKNIVGLVLGAMTRSLPVALVLSILVVVSSRKNHGNEFELKCTSSLTIFYDSSFSKFC